MIASSVCFLLECISVIDCSPRRLKYYNCASQSQYIIGCSPRCLQYTNCGSQSQSLCRWNLFFVSYFKYVRFKNKYIQCKRWTKTDNDFFVKIVIQWKGRTERFRRLHVALSPLVSHFCSNLSSRLIIFNQL